MYNTNFFNKDLIIPAKDFLTSESYFTSGDYESLDLLSKSKLLRDLAAQSFLGEKIDSALNQIVFGKYSEGLDMSQEVLKNIKRNNLFPELELDIVFLGGMADFSGFYLLSSLGNSAYIIDVLPSTRFPGGVADLSVIQSLGGEIKEKYPKYKFNKTGQNIDLFISFLTQKIDQEKESAQVSFYQKLFFDTVTRLNLLENYSHGLNQIETSLVSLSPGEMARLHICDAWIKPDALAYGIEDEILEEILKECENEGIKLLLKKDLIISPNIYKYIHPHGYYEINKETYKFPMKMLIFQGEDSGIYKKLYQIKKYVRDQYLNKRVHIKDERFPQLVEHLHNLMHSSDNPFEAYSNITGIISPVGGVLNRFSYPSQLLTNI